jgi:hypothetical protein
MYDAISVDVCGTEEIASKAPHIFITIKYTIL